MTIQVNYNLEIPAAVVNTDRGTIPPQDLTEAQIRAYTDAWRDALLAARRATLGLASPEIPPPTKKDRILKLLAETDFSQAKIAKLVGTSQCYVSLVKKANLAGGAK